jgi:hypothetical protein
MHHPYEPAHDVWPKAAFHRTRAFDRTRTFERARARLILTILGLACLGLAAAQVPSGDPSPFIEAEIEMETSVELPGGGSTGVKSKININTDGLGTVIDAVIGALCRIFPCKGDEEQAQALLNTRDRTIGDARTGIILEGGAVGIGDLFGGIVTQESTYEWGFSVRFDRDARVRVRSLTFVRDAFLSDAYLETVGLAGKYYVAAGTYLVVDHKLTVPVRQQRE